MRTEAGPAALDARRRTLRGSGPVVGIDLAGSETRRTGFCRMGVGLRTETEVLGPDDEIVAAVQAASPRVVSIDAPLFLPMGRPSIETPGPFHLRASDRVLLRLGIRFFPVTLGPMRDLTARGHSPPRAPRRRKGSGRSRGIPGAGQDLLGIPAERGGVERSARGSCGRVSAARSRRVETTHDELDAASAACLGERYMAGDFVAIGDPCEGWMVLARRRRSSRASGSRGERRANGQATAPSCGPVDDVRRDVPGRQRPRGISAGPRRRSFASWRRGS